MFLIKETIHTALLQIFRTHCKPLHRKRRKGSVIILYNNVFKLLKLGFLAIVFHYWNVNQVSNQAFYIYYAPIVRLCLTSAALLRWYLPKEHAPSSNEKYYERLMFNSYILMFPSVRKFFKSQANTKALVLYKLLRSIFKTNGYRIKSAAELSKQN
jgi:hypothetical protein